MSLEKASHDQKLINSLELSNFQNSPETNLPEKSSASYRLFKELTANELPIEPYDESEFSEFYYVQHHELRCTLCTSPLRNLVEKVYLNSNKRSNTVVNFFKKHYNAKLNWQQVSQHMEYHCDFRKVSTSGLGNYEGRENEISKWKYREYDLALTALLVEIDDIRGMDARTPDMKLRRAQMIEKLLSKLLQLRKERDEAGSGLLNVFEVLLDLHGKLLYEEDKKILKQMVADLRSKLEKS